MEDIKIEKFGLGALPPKLHGQFEGALSRAHATIQEEREAFEDPGGPGPQLESKSGNIRITVTLTVHIDVAIESGAASIVGQVSESKPKRRAVRAPLHMRRSGFYVEEEQTNERLPLLRGGAEAPTDQPTTVRLVRH